MSVPVDLTAIVPATEGTTKKPTLTRFNDAVNQVQLDAKFVLNSPGSRTNGLISDRPESSARVEIRSTSYHAL